MSNIKIVTDSASDILELEGVDLAVAPLKVISDEREFVDDASLNAAEVSAYFAAYKGKSQTSCPNAADWIDAFGNAEQVICMTITSGLSGSYNAASVAAQRYEKEHAGRRVFVVDSLSAGPEISLLLYRCAEMVRHGVEFDRICENITKYKETTGLLFMLKSLRNFANNGRVSPAVAKIVGLLGICIVGRASDEGTLEQLDKCRGEAKSLETIVRRLEENGLRTGRVSIAHCQNSMGAKKLRALIKAKFPEAKTEIHELRGLCSYYAELGGILVGYEKR